MRNEFLKPVRLLLFVLAGAVFSFAIPVYAETDDADVLPVEQLRAFAEVFGRIKHDYVDVIDDRKLITQAISGMLSGLDPHSAYLNKEEFREMQVGTQGEFGGIGIEIGVEDGFIKVVAPMDDSPASRAGIKAGDLIVKLGDQFIKGIPVNDAIKQMRGIPDTPIKLTIERKGEENPLVFTLMRSVIKIQSVKATLLEPGYAYFRISQFQAPTGEALASAVRTLFAKNQGPMKGLILDLRNDPGGLLDAAVAVSATFLPSDTLVVYTDGRAEDAKMRLTASPENYLTRENAQDYLTGLPPGIKDVPMVVLVNGGSASASEIVAGALQDNLRAVVMGEPTFGKASVQTVMPLVDGSAIKLTIARYYTPSGRSIQARGIVPDILLEADSARDTGFSVHEADLRQHLANDRLDGTAAEPAQPGASVINFTPALRPKTVDATLTRPAPGEILARSDYELEQAIAFLKSRAPAQTADVKTVSQGVAAAGIAAPSLSHSFK